MSQSRTFRNCQVIDRQACSMFRKETALIAATVLKSRLYSNTFKGCTYALASNKHNCHSSMNLTFLKPPGGVKFVFMIWIVSDLLVMHRVRQLKFKISKERKEMGDREKTSQLSNNVSYYSDCLFHTPHICIVSRQLSMILTILKK